ncbi:hypothetical protein L9F63_026960 [Diploptera punctata]|uniref:Uncharacterized protein n=1 Tax=Diploptera punctata TaxID=6984 RepID=A0AAD8AEB5_DIPPU|nr:hypothetical protein L9F63_026960 [Diploptera punctata]
MSRELLDAFKHSCRTFIKSDWKYVSVFSNILFSDVKSKIIRSLHAAHLWTLTVDTLTSGYNYFYEKFDVVIILGQLETPAHLLGFLDDFSLLESMIILPEQNGTLQIITLNYDRCGIIVRSSPVKFLATCKVANLFPTSLKIPQRPKMYRNCSFVLPDVHDPPFTISAALGKVVGGIEFKIIQIIASYLGFNVRHLYFDYGPLRRKEILGFLYDFTIYPYLDPSTFMERYYTMKYTWFVPRAELCRPVSILTRVMNSDIWKYVLLSMFSIYLTLKTIHFFYSIEVVKYLPNTCTNGFKFSGRINSRLKRLRPVFFNWMLFLIFFAAVFQALIVSCMTSFFTDPGKHHQIDTNEELENSNLNLSFIRNIGSLNSWKLFVANKSEFILFKNRSTMFRYFLHSPNFAVLTSEEVVMYNLRFLGELNSSVTFHKFNIDVINIHKTLIMDIKSPFVPLINIIIRQLVEAGIVDEIVESVSIWILATIQT